MPVVKKRKCSVYELCADDGSITPLLGFVDEDIDEVFYTCAWGRLDHIEAESESEAPKSKSGAKRKAGSGAGKKDFGDFYLAFAGQRGIVNVRIFGGDMEQEQREMVTTRPLWWDPNPTLLQCFMSHGGAINWLKVHPSDQSLLFSASKDESIRMWSVRSGACAAVFAGDQGHISEVGTRMASAGMDSSIRIWTLEKLGGTIEAAHNAGPSFKPAMLQLPLFITNLSNIWQANYIDCIHWIGDMLLAKSVHNKIVLLECIKGSKKDTICLRHEFPITHCDIWYLRFAVDRFQRWVALGNMSGVTYVWSVDDGAVKQPVIKLSHQKVNTTIRHCAFALDKYLLTSTDDARVVVWNVVRANSKATPDPQAGT